MTVNLSAYREDFHKKLLCCFGPLVNVIRLRAFESVLYDTQTIRITDDYITFFRDFFPEIETYPGSMNPNHNWASNPFVMLVDRRILDSQAPGAAFLALAWMAHDLGHITWGQFYYPGKRGAYRFECTLDSFDEDRGFRMERGVFGGVVGVVFKTDVDRKNYSVEDLTQIDYFVLLADKKLWRIDIDFATQWMAQDSYIDPRLHELNPPVLKENATMDDILPLACVAMNRAVYTESERASIAFEKEMSSDPSKIWRLSEVFRGKSSPTMWIGKNGSCRGSAR